jgi:hypothetical protein
MTRHTITPPSISVSDTREVLETLAEAYSNPLQNVKRQNISYDYDSWATTLRSIYPISNYEPVISTLENNPTPANLRSESRKTNSSKENAKGCFLRIAVGDMLATAYIEDRLADVPERIFTILYQSPDAPGEAAAAALVLSGFGSVHPNVDYFDAILKSNSLGDFAALFCHLQFSWVIAPDRCLQVYKDILSNGHPLLESKNSPPNLTEPNDWYTRLAEAVVGPILSNRGTPFGFANHPLVRADDILATAGYPHTESKFRELVTTTVKHTNVSEMPRATKNKILKSFIFS